MMTSTEFRQWANERGVNTGAASVDCHDIAEAEGYVADYPADCHGFACCGSVEVEYTDEADTVSRLRSALRAAGYSYDAEAGWWTRDGFRAQATHNSSTRYAMIHVYCAISRVALGVGAEGYLPSDSRP